MPFDDEDVNGCDHTGWSSSGLKDARGQHSSDQGDNEIREGRGGGAIHKKER
jgi:hypothetical protein